MDMTTIELCGERHWLLDILANNFPNIYKSFGHDPYDYHISFADPRKVCILDIFSAYSTAFYVSYVRALYPSRPYAANSARRSPNNLCRLLQLLQFVLSGFYGLGNTCKNVAKTNGIFCDYMRDNLDEIIQLSLVK